MAIYKIHEDNMPKLIEKLKKIENKCKKYHCSFTFAEVGEEYKEVKHTVTDGREKVTIKTTLERFIIVEAEGKAIINDWQFVATLEHTENGNIVGQANNEIDLPKKYLTVSPTCEHCNSNRYRKDTYIIINTITSELKQVGKSCLRDYTNGMDAEMVANYLSYFEYLAKLNDHESNGGCTRHYIEIETYLLNVAETIRIYGFISKQKAEENNQLSTVSRVNNFMNDCDVYAKKEKEKIGYDPERVENKETVKNALSWIISLETDGGYLHNLKMVSLKNYTEYRDQGLLASLFSAYYKTLETEQQKKDREAKKINQTQSKYVGNIGDKIQKELTFVKYFCYETQYGTTTIYLFEDSEGNIYKWNSTKIIDKNEGEQITLKGTIKDHEEYKEQKQTVLTRCKVI